MTRLLTALAGWKGYALTAGAMLAIGFGAGWTVRDWKAAADHRGELSEKVRTVERIVYRERAQADVTSAVETKAAEAQVQIRTVTQTIIKEVPVYVSPETDARFALPVGLVRVHDAAAAGHPLPEPSGQPDDAAGNAQPSDIPPSRLAATIAANYGVCLADAARFSALQDWIRQQQAVTNAP
ncbi:MAG: hypothetical protein ACRED4_07010 [Brevundimonas sp.]